MPVRHDSLMNQAIPDPSSSAKPDASYSAWWYKRNVNMQHRVLYIARAPFVSGAERALESMLRHLDRSRVQAGVVLGHDTALRASVQAMGLPVWVVPLAQRTWKSWWWWRNSVCALQRIASEFKPTVLHANDVPSAQAMSVLGAKMKIPRVVHVRWGITANDMNWWLPGGVDTVLCISGWVKEQLGDCQGTQLQNAQATVLPDAVDWPAENGGEPNRHRRGAGEPVRIGFAGQLIHDKGLDVVIAALAQVPADKRPQLLVAGADTQTGGRYQAQLQQQAEKLGVRANIHWLGFLPKVSDLYEQVQAMVCPSRVEPLGLVPLEAARFGLPTLAHDTGGFRETIIDGQTGWLLPMENVSAWAQALAMLHDDVEVQRRGQNAWHHTRQHFAPAVYQAGLMKVYDGGD